MPHTTKQLPQSQIELTITVPKESLTTHLHNAANRLSERGAVKGFRPGKVPYDIMVRHVGEMAILQEALEDIVKESFYEAVTAEKLSTIGMPKITMKKVAPGNDLEYTAIVALLPKVELPDLAKISITKKTASVSDEQVNETLNALRGMHATEVVKSGPAESTDKLVIDMNILLDNVPVEGGQAKDYQVYLSEPHYIPGFNEQVTGLKKGDEKKFSLAFPKDHYQKMLAGKNVDFQVTVKDVFERQLPELNDELAKKVGQKSAEELRVLIKNNLLQDAERRAVEQTEIDMLNTLIEKTTFGDIPEVIVDAERQKMFYELQRDLEKNGITIEQYLSDIKKKEEELFNDFKAQAEKRAKAALLSRQVATEQHIVVSDEELSKEIEMMKAIYKDNKEAQENLKKKEVHDTIATSLQNRKVIAWLTEQLVKEATEEKSSKKKKSE